MAKLDSHVDAELLVFGLISPTVTSDLNATTFLLNTRNRQTDSENSSRVKRKAVLLFLREVQVEVEASSEDALIAKVSWGKLETLGE